MHIRAKSYALAMIAAVTLADSMEVLAAEDGSAGSGAVQASGVRIWWGHTEGDAEWACNAWISTCGNNGGCYAFRVR